MKRTVFIQPCFEPVNLVSASKIVNGEITTILILSGWQGASLQPGGPPKTIDLAQEAYDTASLANAVSSVRR